MKLLIELFLFHGSLFARICDPNRCYQTETADISRGKNQTARLREYDARWTLKANGTKESSA